MDNDKQDSAKKSIKPDIPGLKAMESGKSKGATGNSNSKSASGITGNVSQQLGGMESSGAAGFNFNPGGDKRGLLKRFGGAVGRNKFKSGLAGGAGIGIIVAIVLGIGSVASYALVTIEKDLLKYEGKVEQYAEEKADKSIMKHMLCRALASNTSASTASGCKNDGDPEDEPNADDPPGETDPAQESQVADTEEGDNSLTKEMDDFDWTNSQVEQDLSNQGIKVDTTASGEFNGLTDSSTGNPITTSDIANDPATFNSLDAALPEWDVGQEEVFRPLMEEHAGDSFEGLPDTADDDPAKDIVDDVTNGATQSEANQAQSEDDQNEETTPESSTVPASEVQQYQSEASENNTIEQAAENAIKDGDTESQAITAADDSVDLGNSLLISTVASDVCGVKQIADKSSGSRVPTIMKLAMRHVSVLLSIADQMKTGHITGKEISDVMSILDGDPSVASTIADPTHPGATEVNEASLPWDRSAAWLRISGDASGVDTNPDDSNYTPDLDSSSMPVANDGTQVVNEVNDAVDDIGGNFVCDVEESPFGSVANFLGNAAGLVSGGLDFGASDVAIAGGVTAVQELLQHVVIPEIVKYFTPVGLFGNEFSTQWMDVADMGANLSFNDYSRALGAEPVDNTQADGQYALANEAQQQSENSQSFGYRAFALSNPDSLVSKLILDLPLSKLQLFGNITSYFTNISQELTSSLSTIFTPKSLSADSTNPSTEETPGLAYGITQYGFSNVAQYDPVANEMYLDNTKITYNGTTASLMTMLGDPFNYPNATLDPSTTDVLHCFTQNFDNPTSNDNTIATETSPDPICGSLGNYDYSTSGNSNNGSLPPDQISPTNVATSFCDYFANPSSPSSGSATQDCISAITPTIQQDDVMDHFRQYIMDVHVVSNYTTLTNSQ